MATYRCTEPGFHVEHHQDDGRGHPFGRKVAPTRTFTTAHNKAWIFQNMATRSQGSSPKLDEREWASQALKQLAADERRSADTHLLRLDALGLEGVDIYLKDESTHPSGSLKHRLARSLFTYALCNGWIHQHTTVIEASSGSTAVSEAYFARMLGLEFIAVMPKDTSPAKIAIVSFYGGKVHLVEDGGSVYAEASRLEKELDGHYLDQFTYAERATDFRSNNSIAQSIFQQMELERHPVPSYIVCGAGTGGTSATLARYTRSKGHLSKICVADPENSVFYDYWRTGDATLTRPSPSRIEGIGRPRVEPSFIRGIIDDMIQVPDAASIAAMRVLAEVIGRKPGGSTGCIFYATLQLARRMLSEGRKGSIVAVMCDPGERYADTYYNDAWLTRHSIDIAPHVTQIREFVLRGAWKEL